MAKIFWSHTHLQRIALIIQMRRWQQKTLIHTVDWTMDYEYSHITVRCSETIKPDLLFEQVALTKKELRCCPVQHTI